MTESKIPGIGEEEQIRFRLHELYRRHGYNRFKMNKFEEYELYLQNREFVETENIIVFNDMNGRLMALKPDLTLSIVKNFRPEKDVVSKVYYSENIYRYLKENRAHQEFMQTGLECMGAIDSWQIAEVTALAAKSLNEIGRNYVLEISHMGIIADLLSDIQDEGIKQDIVRLIGEKNLHDIRRIIEENNISKEIEGPLEAIVTTYGNWEDARAVLESLPLGETGKSAISELSEVFEVLKNEDLGNGQVRIDFSIVNDMNYYSGILFKGFIDGVPRSVLSGGQYDLLLRRMGKEGGAIGFAVYLDYLEQVLSGHERNDADVLLLYDEEDSASDIQNAFHILSQRGKSVLTERAVPEKIRFGEILKVSDFKKTDGKN
ncbi:MAG: ATP phosphoribosyltransferase regulatory subunit [Eubacteriales bacterium]|nr:ATP phosphoribosyltransferase regulatory subunit [Eubacteriales bacterium]